MKKVIALVLVLIMALSLAVLRPRPPQLLLPLLTVPQ